ncbi:hypothetical protein FF098_014595 [Parvularcula flava]|uniref:Uncharacterized protein n=1 Tax=Aquisalinus luteolus TaxID=1566827 RepID=A0A8J3ERT7_9PROT|nr:hypothetical protein [Aquisalinus luteolus]NHK29146.1 hypothetical protein [Aquisalinus luteolus]GGI00167.1 hypothetical protein GCM10011355_27820 [Aquisalinus luteolus]
MASDRKYNGIVVHSTIPNCAMVPRLELMFIDGELCQLMEDGWGEPFWLKVQSGEGQKDPAK